MTRNERFTERNKIIRQCFYKLSKDNPKWRIEAVIESVADKYFLAPRTIEAIISHEGIYNEAHIKKPTQQLKLL